MSKTIRILATFLIALASLVSSTAWGAKLEGDYSGTGNSFFEKLSFRPDGKVRVTFMGMTKVGTFEVDGKEVLITVGNETNVFTFNEQGCVVGGGFLGKYCKGGAKGEGDQAAKDASVAKPGTAKGVGNAKLSGKYAAGNSDFTIALDFKTDQQVRISVSGKKAKSDSKNGTYKVAGDRVTVSVPDGSPPLLLIRKGNTLEGAPPGESVKLKFVKQ
jgi:hypothetical protein